jgi:hypothetical protein
MIKIFRSIIVIFDTILQILLRRGLNRSERNNMTDRVRELEDEVDDKEFFIENKKEEKDGVKK